MKKKSIWKSFGITIAAVCIFGIVSSCVHIIPTGYTGVKTSFGNVSENELKTGIHFTVPLVQSIKEINNKQQDTVCTDKIWGETTDKTPVYAENVTITYSIASDKSVWLYCNVSNVDRIVNNGIVASALKAAMAELGPEDVTNRGKIEPLAQQKLTEAFAEKYGDDAVTIHQVIIGNMDFEDEYNDAIQQKSIAQQTAARQKIENETAIAKAEADKTVAIKNAEAKAEKVRIEAEAQADANKKLADSISDTLIDYEKIEKWDGKLPTVTGGNAIVSLDGDEETTDTAGSGDSGNSEK